jgi:hypothetical protein
MFMEILYRRAIWTIAPDGVHHISAQETRKQTLPD